MRPLENGDDVPGRLEELELTVGKLMQDRTEFGSSTPAREEGGDRGGGVAAVDPKPGPWWWEALDAADQAHLWRELRAFVAMLGRRYFSDVASGKQLPLCWYRHPVAVEMLTALMVAHRSVYFDQEHPTQELMQFHEWWLWPTLDRFEQLKIFTSCQTGGHRPRRTYGPLAGHEDSEDFDAFVRTQTQADAT